MKKKWLTFITALLLCVLVGHQGSLLVQAKTSSEILEEIFEIGTFENDEVELSQVAIEVKADKDLSGILAVIYEKEYDDVRLQSKVAQFYRDDFSKTNKWLIDKYEDLYKKFNKRLVKIGDEVELNQVSDGLTMINDYIKVLENDPLSTLDMEIQQAIQIASVFDTAFRAEFDLSHPTYRDEMVAVERVKNIDLQKLIDDLNEQQNDYYEKAKEASDVIAMEELSLQFETMLSQYDHEVRVTGSDFNENEVFIKISFDHFESLHSGFVIGEYKGLNSVEPSLQEQINAIQNKYYEVELEPQILKVTRTFLEEVRIKTEQINTIVLEREGIRLIKDFSNKFNEAMSSDEASENADEVLHQLMNEFEAALVSYESLENKIEDDSMGVDRLKEMIEDWSKDVEKESNKAKTASEYEVMFGKYHIFAFHSNEPIPVGMRISVEGDFIMNTLPNGQLDIYNNYYVNMANSGNSAMRLLAGESDFTAVFEPDLISFEKVKVLLVAFMIILVILFFVKREWFKNVMTMVVLLTLMAIVIYPLIWVVGASFNESSSLGAVGINPFPKKFSILQYERLFLTTDYGKWFMNSFKIAIANMIITVSLAVSAAYAFSRFKFKGKKVGLMTMLIIQIFPSFSAMVAIYTLLANVKFLEFLTGEVSLVNTHLGLILVYCAGQIPYNTWLVKGYFDALPRSMDEAAKIDGASNIQAFLKIILPLGRPIIAFVAVTSFMAPWMDFILPRLLLKSTEKKTLAVGLYEMINGNSNNQFTMFAAGAVLVAVPITLLYAYFQKYIVKGLASGAVKG